MQKQVVLGSLCSFLALSAEGLLVAKKDTQEVLIVEPNTFEVKKKIFAPHVERVLSGPKLRFALVIPECKRERPRVSDPSQGNIGYVLMSSLVKLLGFGVSDTSQGNVGYLDLADGKITNQLDIPASCARITPDGQHYFAVKGKEDELCHFRIEGTKLIAAGTSERIPGNAQNLCVSADSKLVCLAGGGNGRDISTYIFGVDDLRRPILGLTSGGRSQAAVEFDPAAKLIYAQNDQYQVLVYSMKNIKLKEYLPTSRDSGEARQMVPHPQGRKLLLATSKWVIFVELPAE